MGHKVVQVFANPFEQRMFENGEHDACGGRRTSACPVRARSGGFEFKPKILEAGQRGEGSEHVLG